MDLSAAGGQGRPTQGRASVAKSAARGASAAGTTDETGELANGERLEADLAEAHRIARQIAERLTVRRTRRSREATPSGLGVPASMPYRGGADEIDLERTVAGMIERPTDPEPTIFVYERLLNERAVVLAVDTSGSMRGERIRTAAATVGALAGEMRHDRLGVLAFWSDTAVLLHLGMEVRPHELLDTLLGLPAKGLTNVAFPLQTAATELRSERARDQRVLLLSDALHNAGPDPRDAASRLPRVDVLLDASGEHDELLGREIAAAGAGRFQIVRSHRDVAPALSRIYRD